MLSKVLAVCFMYTLITIYVLHRVIIPKYESSNNLGKFFIVVVVVVVSFIIPVLVIYAGLSLV